MSDQNELLDYQECLKEKLEEAKDMQVLMENRAWKKTVRPMLDKIISRLEDIRDIENIDELMGRKYALSELEAFINVIEEMAGDGGYLEDELEAVK